MPSRTCTHGARELVGDRDPRAHEFSVQLRALDNDRSGTSLGLPALMALCSGLLEKSTKGGLIVVGALNLGGSSRVSHQRSRYCRGGGREGSHYRADAGLGAETAFRTVRRHGYANQYSVLLGCAGCAAEGTAGVVGTSATPRAPRKAESYRPPASSPLYSGFSPPGSSRPRGSPSGPWPRRCRDRG